MYDANTDKCWWVSYYEKGIENLEPFILSEVEVSNKIPEIDDGWLRDTEIIAIEDLKYIDTKGKILLGFSALLLIFIVGICIKRRETIDDSWTLPYVNI